jgi:hypothetical protein
MDGRMKEQQPKPDNITILRRWIAWAAVVGTGLWTGYFFAFLVYHSLAADPDTENWFLRMVQAQPAAMIGLAISAISAFCLVALLEIARGPIEFEALGFKLKGQWSRNTLGILLSRDDFWRLVALGQGWKHRDGAGNSVGCQHQCVEHRFRNAPFIGQRRVQS